jgi:hypothetical protein
MATETLIWTALPNGFDENGDLRISAIVAPRLVPDADEILEPFDDFLDWPEALRHAKFTIRYGGQAITIAGTQTAAAARIDGTTDLADTAVWQALFSEHTPVAGFVFRNATASTVLSYDTVAMDQTAHLLYATLARATGDALPKSSEILSNPLWQRLIEAVSLVDRTFTDERTGLRDASRQFELLTAGKLVFQDQLATLFAHAQLFHTPPSKQTTQNYAGASLPPDDPRLLSKTTWRTYVRASGAAEGGRLFETRRLPSDCRCRQLVSATAAARRHRRRFRRAASDIRGCRR